MPDMPGLIARPRFIRLHDDYMNASTENRRLMGLGLLETIRVAERLPESRMTRRYFSRPRPADPVQRPLETWWMCSGNRFEVNVLDGDQQVTMMILTPAMPSLPDSRKVKLEHPGFIWTAGHQTVLQGYRNEYPKGQTRYPTLKQAYRVPRRERDWRQLRRINKFQE